MSVSISEMQESFRNEHLVFALKPRFGINVTRFKCTVCLDNRWSDSGQASKHCQTPRHIENIRLASTNLKSPRRRSAPKENVENRKDITPVISLPAILEREKKASPLSRRSKSKSRGKSSRRKKRASKDAAEPARGSMALKIEHVNTMIPLLSNQGLVDVIIHATIELEQRNERDTE